MDQDIQRLGKIGARLQDNIQRVIVGKRSVAELALIAILCEGHLLIEDVPGLGKTTLARAIARSLGCTFRRIQSTPDLLPSDLTGTHIFNQRTNDFEFRPGPIFAQVILVDEVNRAVRRQTTWRIRDATKGNHMLDIEGYQEAFAILTGIRGRPEGAGDKMVFSGARRAGRWRKP